VLLITRLGLRTRTGTPRTRETFRAPEKKPGGTLLVRTRVPSLSVSRASSPLLSSLLRCERRDRQVSFSHFSCVSPSLVGSPLSLTGEGFFTAPATKDPLYAAGARARLFYTPNVIQRCGVLRGAFRLLPRGALLATRFRPFAPSRPAQTLRDVVVTVCTRVSRRGTERRRENEREREREKSY
jgi:hypothetical protein